MNPNIKYVRDCALELLKPSKKDLEHGFELHKNSIVFDSYGFSPTSSIDGDAAKAAVEAGASPIEIQDIIEETMMTRHVYDQKLYEEYLENWNESGVTCVFQNAGEESNNPMRIIKRLARFTFVTDMLKEKLNRAISAEDVEKTKKEGKSCLFFSSNGVPIAGQFNNAEEELGYIRILFQLGCRMMHMTYNRRNMIGDGCAESANAGLSDFGRMVVKEMNRVGVICDVAHSGWQTSIEVAECSDKPVVSSHSACNALNQHIRAKSDEVIKAIVDSGGYNGICCLPAFLGGKGDISALLDHIDYMVKKFGADHVAIGTDCGFSSSDWASEYSKYEVVARKKRPNWESFWPDKTDTTGNKFSRKHTDSLSWMNWPLFTVGLVQRGHSDDDIRKIIGGNVMRVIRAQSS